MSHDVCLEIYRWGPGDLFGQQKREVGAGVMPGGQPYHSQQRQCANVVLIVLTRDALHVGSGAAEPFFSTQRCRPCCFSVAGGEDWLECR